MSIVFVLVPLATLLVLAFVAAFAWSVQRGQLDDLVTPALRVLGEDKASPPSHVAAAPTAHPTDLETAASTARTAPSAALDAKSASGSA
jgi:cbb3-type cytochrome oxidase maturation protein